MIGRFLDNAGKPEDALSDAQLGLADELVRRTAGYLNAEAAGALLAGRVGFNADADALAAAGRGPRQVLTSLMASGCTDSVRSKDARAMNLPADRWPNPDEWRLERV